MEKVIEVEFRLTWNKAVYIRIGSGWRERIDGPDAALQALAHRWPSDGGAAFLAAKAGCIEALIRHGSAETARRKFIDAAIEVGVYA